jgi:putative flippase GtrA
LKKLNWKLIIILAVFALVRPVMSMLGISEAIGKPVASIGATIIISFVWITAVVRAQESQPVLTLMLVGIGYAVLAIIISGIFSPILLGQLQGPLTNMFAFVSVFVTNAIWGLIAGVIASVFVKGETTK